MGFTTDKPEVGEPMGLHNYWVAVKEFRLSYHNGYIYIYIMKRGVPPYNNFK